MKNRSVIYNKPSVPRLLVKIFYSVTSFPKGPLATEASGFLSILQRRLSCHILSRNQGNFRLAMSLSSHSLKGLEKGKGFRDTPDQISCSFD